MAKDDLAFDGTKSLAVRIDKMADRIVVTRYDTNAYGDAR